MTLKNRARQQRDVDAVRTAAQELVDWLRAGVPAANDPPVIAHARLLVDPDGNWLSKAGYRSSGSRARLVRSLLWQVEPVDLVTGEPMIGIKLVEASGSSRRQLVQVEREHEHHVFPRSWLVKRPPIRAGGDVDQPANLALLSPATNSWISDRGPADYVTSLDKAFGPEHVDRILATHLLDGALLRENAFADQMTARADRLAAMARRILDPRELHVVQPVKEWPRDV
ncbi:hypothetical protein DSM104329_01086 [Capillimicrobium parvum]|uniref:Uncharacterized protein n=2 Tax=Capillimicrobium parvum TaxID=2884022 RepID=A0A9E6XUI8_9ACTN|nr:hypothetical protein DSM104329_01086 [Capillimicrobium parvum]